MLNMLRLICIHTIRKTNAALQIFYILRHICVHALAPAVSLTTNSSRVEGIVNAIEESAISFNCDYDDVIPPGNQSLFNFNGNEIIKSKVSEAEIVDNGIH